jgi:dienelactone hydrolase
MVEVSDIKSAPGEALPYDDEERTYRGVYVARPSGTSVRAGVLIVPDWRGISPFARQQAQLLSRAGYDVALVDLYGDGLYADDEAQASTLLKGLIENRSSGVSRMRACLAAFQEKLPETTKIIVLGYSVGGMVGLDLGRSGTPLAGIVLCSALLKTAAPGQPTKIEVPVLALHGSRDVVCPPTMVQDLISEMDLAGNDFRVVLYGRTHHAFYNPNVGTDPAARLVYSKESDKASIEEIARFLDKLSSSVPSP